MRATKTKLTPEEMITAAYHVDVLGKRQQDVAVMLGVSNNARVNEACMAIRKAIGTRPRGGYKDREKHD